MFTAVTALHIQLVATGDFLKEDLLDLSPLQKFPQLVELWIFGVVAQKVALRFHAAANVTELHLPLRAIHFIRLTVSNSAENYLQLFTGAHQATVVNFKECRLAERLQTHGDLFENLSSNSVKAIALQRIQNDESQYFRREWRYDAIFRTDRKFAELEYLDLSFNSIEYLSLEVMRNFLRLKFIDLSNNHLDSAHMTHNIDFRVLAFFHPEIEVLGANSQGIENRNLNCAAQTGRKLLNSTRADTQTHNDESYGA